MKSKTKNHNKLWILIWFISFDGRVEDEDEKRMEYSVGLHRRWICSGNDSRVNLLK